MLVIQNPGAGRFRKASRYIAQFVRAVETRGCTAVVRNAGAAPGGAERLAREAEAAFDVVMAAGGDGTAQAVANGLAGTARAMGVLPLGTANVLARELGLPRRAEDLAALVAHGSPRPVWPGRIGSRLFLTMASAGFDAAVVAAVDPRLKRRFGRMAFAWTIAERWLRFGASYRIVVRVEGVEHRAATVIAAKARYYAGPFVIAPQARLAEPSLALLLFRRPGRPAVLRYLAALAAGKIADLPDVTLLRATRAEVAVAPSLPFPVPVQADGEILGCLPVEIGVAERPLMMVCP